MAGWPNENGTSRLSAKLGVGHENQVESRRGFTAGKNSSGVLSTTCWLIVSARGEPPEAYQKTELCMEALCLPNVTDPKFVITSTEGFHFGVICRRCYHVDIKIYYLS